MARLMANVIYAGKTRLVTSDNNNPVESYQALLIADDPTGRVARVFHSVMDLTKEKYDRYSEGGLRRGHSLLVRHHRAPSFVSAKRLRAAYGISCRCWSSGALAPSWQRKVKRRAPNSSAAQRA
jgi:hypothetical protein